MRPLVLAALAAAMAVFGHVPAARAAPRALRVPAAFRGHAALFARADPDRVVTLPSGRSTTMQGYVDELAAIAARGLSSLPREAFVTEDAARFARGRAARLATERARLRTGADTRPAEVASAQTWEWGSRKYLSTYASFAASASSPSGAACAVSWEAGAYVHDERRPMARFVAEYGSDPARQKAAFYELAERAPAWQRTSNVAEPITFTSRLPAARLRHDFVRGVLGAEGSIAIAFTVTLHPIARGGAAIDPRSAECSLGVTPSITSSVVAEGRLTFADPELAAHADLFEGGIEAHGAPIDLKIAIAERVKAGGGRLAVDARGALMAASIDAVFDLRDECLGAVLPDGRCDGPRVRESAAALGLPARTVRHFWSEDGLPIDARLADLTY